MVDGISSPTSVPSPRAYGDVRDPARAAPELVSAPEARVSTFDSKRLAKDLSARPPVDAERVAALRIAIQSGNYPIDAERIADAMLKQERSTG